MSFANFGGCYDGNLETVECTVDGTGCENLSKPYTSSYDIWGDKQNKGCPAASVSAAGRCGGVCVGSADACFHDQHFVLDPDCDLVRDRKSNTATLYGACQRNTGSGRSTCAFDAASCSPSEIYVVAEKAANGSPQPCTCDVTLTGLCDKGYPDMIEHFKDHDAHYCAVRREQCVGVNETFVSRSVLKNSGSVYGLNKCTVCDKLPPDVRIVSDFRTNKVDTTDTTTGGVDMKGAEIVAVAVGSLAGVLLILLGWKRYKKKTKGPETGESEENESKGFLRVFWGFFS